TGRAFLCELPEVPVRYAPIHELGKTKNAAPVAETLAEEISDIYQTDFFQAAIFDQCPKQVPGQDETIPEGMHDFVFFGPRKNLPSPAPEFRLSIGREISVEKGL